MPPARGGRGGARGGGAFNAARGTISIGGVEHNWDLTGLKIEKRPAERFPVQPPPQAPPPTEDELKSVKYYLAIRDRIHNGPFYTVLNDSMRNGLKRKANDPAPTEAQLFNPFTDNETYTSKYHKVRRRLPKLDSRPYVKELFPKELWDLLGDSKNDADRVTDGAPAKKRKTLQIAKDSALTRIDQYMEQQGQRLKDIEERGEDYDEEAEDEFDDDDEDEEKPDAVEEEDNWSAVSSDSEESGDDYNAERYFDNGDDDDIDDDDGYENTYD